MSDYLTPQNDEELKARINAEFQARIDEELSDLIDKEFQDQILAYLKAKLGDSWVLWNEAGRSRNWGEEVAYVMFGELFSQSNSDLVPMGEYLYAREGELIRFSLCQAIRKLSDKGETA